MSERAEARIEVVRGHDAYVLQNATSIAPRLWSKVQFGEEVACWLFTGNRPNKKKPYGQLRMGGRKNFWTAQAHRVSLLLSDVPYEGPQMLALHRCGHHSCVNPKHLYWGTAKQNIDDYRRHHPGFPNNVRGENVSTAVLSSEQVAQIWRRYWYDGVTARQLGIDFDVSRMQIVNIIDGISWNAVTSILAKPKQRAKIQIKSRVRRIEPAKKIAMAQDYLNGVTVEMVSRTHDVGLSTVLRAVAWYREQSLLEIAQ